MFPEESRDMFKEFDDPGKFADHYKEIKGKIPQVPEQYRDPDNLQVAEEAKENLERFKTFAKDLGLTQSQYEKLLKGTIEHDTAVIERVRNAVDEDFEKLLDQQQEDAKAELQQVWGGDFEKKVSQVRGFIEASGDKEFVTYLEETGLGNDPRMVQYLYRISTHFKEDSFTNGVIEENDVRRGPDGSPVLRFDSMK
jgi:transcriptional regulator with XRE-family HTH domain